MLCRAIIDALGRQIERRSLDELPRGEDRELAPGSFAKPRPGAPVAGRENKCGEVNGSRATAREWKSFTGGLVDAKNAHCDKFHIDEALLVETVDRSAGEVAEPEVLAAPRGARDATASALPVTGK